MKTLLSLTLLLCFLSPVNAQTAPAWQVISYDVAVNVPPAERSISVVATINVTNVGGTGRTLTTRLNSKISVKSVTVGGAVASFRSSPELKGDLQRVEISLPSSVGPNGTVSVTINYLMTVESNTGVAAISPVGTQFLPLSFWYPTPNTLFSPRGVDTAPFKISVNLSNVVSAGVEKSAAGSSVVYDESLFGEPFFLQGDWEKVDGAGEGKGITVFLEKGAAADVRKGAESLIALTTAARSFGASILGPAPDVPVRLVSVRRGAGFSDSGTVLIDADALRLPRIDAATAMSVAESIARLWLGGQTPIRGEGSGVIRDGLVRFIATLLLEKQFGKGAVQSELYRQRLAYAAVAQRDAPLARANQLDNTYFGSVPNRGAMVCRLLDRRMGRDVFFGTVKNVLQSTRNGTEGLTLPALRAALVERGGESVKALLDQQLDQIIDTDLMVGLPQQRGADWVSALRNLGSVDVTVTVAATTDQGQQLRVETTVPGRNFGEAVFKTTSRIVRVEVDPDKSYPQLDYGNDAVPRSKDLPEALNEATLQLGAQDFAKAESTARQMLVIAPSFQDAKILLARALFGQNKIDEAEKLFRAELEEPLPFTATLAWANIGLGEISMKRGQPAEAVKRFNDAVVASRDYPSSLAARAARIRAEVAANSLPPIDESARTFITQLSQAVVSTRKADLDARVIPGELVRFVNASIGTELWETKVLRTELLNANLLAADVQIRANKLGKEGSGTAVLLLSRVAGGWKLSGIELFEVR